MTVLWVLTDDKPGHTAQSLGVAEKLGLPFVEQRVQLGALGGLPNFFLPRSLWRLSAATRAALTSPNPDSGPDLGPDVVIAAGRRLAPVSLYIKQCHPSAKLVQIMWPAGSPAQAFDCIAVPAHDRASDAPNVLRLPLTPHRLTQATLARAVSEHAALWQDRPRPFTTLLVGGDSKYIRYQAADYRHLLEQSLALAGEGTLLITTSRRTGDAFFDEAARLLPGRAHVLYQYGDAAPNPYLGFLAAASRVVVTGESVSMLSEACFTGVPVFLFNPLSGVSPKHSAFQRSIVARGLATPIGSQLPAIPYQPPQEDAPSLDAAQTLADYIRTHLLKSP